MFSHPVQAQPFKRDFHLRTKTNPLQACIQKSSTNKLRVMSHNFNPEIHQRRAVSPPQLVVFNNKKFITNLSPEQKETIKSLPRKLSYDHLPSTHLQLRQRLKYQEQQLNKTKQQVLNAKVAFGDQKKKIIESNWSPIDAITCLQGSNCTEDKFSAKKTNNNKKTQSIVYEEGQKSNRKSEEIIDSIDLIPYQQAISERPQEEQQEQLEIKQPFQEKYCARKTLFAKTQNKIDLEKNYSISCETQQSSTKNPKSMEHSLIESEIEQGSQEFGEKNKKLHLKLLNLSQENRELEQKLEKVSNRKDLVELQNEKNKEKVKQLLGVLKASQNESEILREKIEQLQKNRNKIESQNKDLKSCIQNIGEKNEGWGCCKGCQKVVKNLYLLTKKAKIGLQ